MNRGRIPERIRDDQSKTYRVWDAQHGSETCVSPWDVLPEDDLVFFLLDAAPVLVNNSIRFFAKFSLRFGAKLLSIDCPFLRSSGHLA